MRVPIQRQNDFPSTILSEVDLDESVERVRSAAARARRDVHDLGVALKDIQDRQLWKLRLDKEGKPSYRHFKDFLKAEIGFSPQHVRKLVAVAENFTPEQVEQHGTTKLSAVLECVPELQPKALKAIEGGATVKEVRRLSKPSEPKREPPRLRVVAPKPESPRGDTDEVEEQRESYFEIVLSYVNTMRENCEAICEDSNAFLAKVVEEASPEERDELAEVLLRMALAATDASVALRRS